MNSQAELRAGVERVELEICDGLEIEDWFRARVRGSNGWVHLRFLVLAVEGPAYDPITQGPTERSRVFWTLKALNEWRRNEWKPLSWDNEADDELAEPSPARIQRWLDETDIVADAFSKAAKCEVVAPDMRFKHTSIFDWAEIAWGFRGRNEVLRQRGKNTQADQELLHFAHTWTKFAYPTTLSERSLARGLAGLAFKWAEELLLLDRMSMETAAAISAIEFDCEGGTREAIEADAAWLAASALKTPWLIDSPSLLGWLRETENNGVGLFDPEDFVKSPRARFVAPMNLTIAVADAIESSFAALQNLDGNELREPSAEPVHRTSTLAMSPVWPYRDAIAAARLRHEQLSLQLRIKQIRGGPLTLQKQAVEQAVRKYRHVTLDWEDENALLGVDPRLVSWRDTVAGLDIDLTESPATRVLEAFRTEENNTTYIEPLAEARERLADEHAPD